MTISGAVTRKSTETRDRNRPLRVVVNGQERAQILAHAKAARMSVSAYLRATGLGFQPQAAADLEAVRELAKVAGDQGRLGGLLKHWLAERPGVGASEYEVGELLADLQAVQASIRTKVAAL